MARVSKLKFVVSKISALGWKVIVVPVVVLLSSLSTGPVGSPST